MISIGSDLSSIQGDWTGRRRSAFTLIELVVALAILGLLTGAVATTIAVPLSSQRSRLAADRFIGWDAKVRRAVRSEHQVRTIGLGQSADTRDALTARPFETASAGSLFVPASPSVERVRLLQARGVWTTDPIAWRMSTDGIAPSIAAKFRSDANVAGIGAEARGDGLTVVVAGLTGQATVLEETEWIDELANTLQSQRPVAD